MHPLFKRADEWSREAIGAAMEVHRERLLLELKCVQEVLPIHKAQLPSYRKLLDVPIGLIFNFHELRLTDGLVRMILPGVNL